MRLSKVLWQTYKDNPADAEVPSHQLMMRAGLIQKSGAGLYNLMPFGLKVIKKIKQIIREEHDREGCLEISMSVVTPGELWQESGRWQAMGDEMVRMKDKGGRDICISPTNEETVTDIFRKSVKSYKELPVTFYQINTKFRDEIRPRFGLLRAREFIMKDAYSFHLDKACLDKTYDVLFNVYSRILQRMGLEYRAVEADAGAMASSDQKTHEFQVLASTGEDQLVYSESYAANIEKAITRREGLDLLNSTAIAEIETPNMKSIEDVSNFLKVKQYQCLKALVYEVTVASKSFPVLAFILGDDELNELKLKNYFSAAHVAPANEELIKSVGLEVGFIGPSSKANIKTIFDKAINPESSYVVGANKRDYHLKGFSLKSIGSAEFVDLRLAKQGDVDASGKEVSVCRGIEVGHIFQLGDKYTKAMNVTVLDKNGKAQTPIMGCYGIGVTRLMAAAIEQNFDQKGIIWPNAITPFHVHFLLIGKSQEIKDIANGIYEKIINLGLDVLFDDRDAGPGFKFKDAELLGVPYQLVLGERDFLQTGKIKFNHRDGRSLGEIAINEIDNWAQELLKNFAI